MAEAEDEGQRRAEFVGDVGEEGLPQRRHLLQRTVVPGAQLLYIYEYDHDGHQHDEREQEDAEADLPLRLLLAQLELDGVHLLALTAALDVDAGILYAVDLLDADDAVLQGVGLLLAR